MRSRRSISDIVAVVLLIVIAIAAAVIIYMWLSGLIGSVHTSTSATQVKLEITGANVTNNSSGDYIVTAYLYNPPGSPSTSITLGELEFTNGTLICSTNTVQVTPSSTITPSGTAIAKFSCKPPSVAPTGTPVEIVLFTSEGVQVTYTTSTS
ncbi:MAG: archaeal flagellin N-terminal-like domain [uncultured Acidilobus sp. MG]|jgi:archaeal flagellin N-terminal-like domain|nr:MAG: archaeal flagellin N-terminal-like domain [uncultured Acidilobus sp. MG]